MGNYQVGYGHSDVAGEPFDYVVPLTGAAIQMQTAKLVINPAGTLATGTITLPLNPPDGCLAEISTTQVLTTAGWSVAANTGDVIVNGVLGAVTGINVTTLATAGNATATVKYRYTLFGTAGNGAPAGAPTAGARTWVRVQ